MVPPCIFGHTHFLAARIANNPEVREKQALTIRLLGISQYQLMRQLKTVGKFWTTHEK